MAAKREYPTLSRVHDAGVVVSVSTAQDRHVIVMSAIEGAELHWCKSLPAPSEILDCIIDKVSLAHNEADAVHGDLSEFNILVTPPTDILIMDWGQWIDVRLNRDWKFRLERDIKNVLKYFQKKI